MPCFFNSEKCLQNLGGSFLAIFSAFVNFSYTFLRRIVLMLRAWPDAERGITA